MEEKTFSFDWAPAQNMRSLAHRLSGLGFTNISVSGSGLRVMMVEGADLSRRPSSYLKMHLTPNRIKLSYAHDGSHSREIGACSLFLEVVSLAGASTRLSPELSSFLRSSLSHANSVMSEDYQALEAKNALLSEEASVLRSKNRSLLALSESLERSLSAERRSSEEMSSRIAALQGLSDSALCELLYEWLRSKGGSIDIHEFAQANQIPPGRVEWGLAKLSSEGYIARKK